MLCYMFVHIRQKLKFLCLYVSSLREHLQFNFNSNVFIGHMVWYVPCMVRFVIKRGPFCPAVVRFVLRWSVLSVVRFVHGLLCP